MLPPAQGFVSVNEFSMVLGRCNQDAVGSDIADDMVLEITEWLLSPVSIESVHVSYIAFHNSAHPILARRSLICISTVMP